jgi:(S)-citramalyl-CoA lyase
MAAELGAARDFTSMLYARSRVVHAAASHGRDAIDVPWLDLEDEAGLLEECRRARDLGFTGKAAIHPKQLAPINAVFTPGPDRIAYARKVIEAFETSEGGLAVVDGKLIEIPVVRSARRTLAIAAATGAA